MKAQEQKQQQETANTNFDKGKQASASSVSSPGVHECFSLKTENLGANMLVWL